MTHAEFKYWVKGYVMLSCEATFTREQFVIIKNHANLVLSIMGKLDESIERFLHQLEFSLVQGEEIQLQMFKQITAEL